MSREINNVLSHGSVSKDVNGLEKKAHWLVKEGGFSSQKTAPTDNSANPVPQSSRMVMLS